MAGNLSVVNTSPPRTLAAAPPQGLESQGGPTTVWAPGRAPNTQSPVWKRLSPNFLPRPSRPSQILYVVQSPTSDITNLQPLDESTHRNLIYQSVRNVVQTMERALQQLVAQSSYGRRLAVVGNMFGLLNQ